ncbi:GNAT family N-acetyltransferase [Antrihabitans sp. YC2-6]|uniref:GNAT family N-acetyltransferase n=1 Tax=Antrihabitans sp. YC2-6 TaxID=2799498 RepID=UPI0018F3A9F7|nr:GNAT family N-acetyltransferase [Antrihabitans sp. YC2-6]MBJ8347140.1 N-acetyltransferase [Antrihabitans sp. YC2-6]
MNQLHVTHNQTLSRFELTHPGNRFVGLLGYVDSRTLLSETAAPRVMLFLHTIISDEYDDADMAVYIVRGSLDHARSLGWKVNAVCTHVQQFVDDHPEYRDVIV